MGHCVCQPSVQVMRLRRAVPKIPAKSSVPPRSPLNKFRRLLTPSESILPQALIPFHFNSFISNAYKKWGVGCFRSAPKFSNSSLPASLPSGHARTPTTSIPSFTSAHLPSPWWWGGGGRGLGWGRVWVGGPQRHRLPAPPLPKLVIPRESRDLLFSSLPPASQRHERIRFSARLRDLCASAYPFLLFAVRRHSLPTHRATVLKKG
jgi:hypothetical protein